jgi:hypothetical protein
VLKGQRRCVQNAARQEHEKRKARKEDADVVAALMAKATAKKEKKMARRMRSASQVGVAVLGIALGALILRRLLTG